MQNSTLSVVVLELQLLRICAKASDVTHSQDSRMPCLSHSFTHIEILLEYFTIPWEMSICNCHWQKHWVPLNVWVNIPSEKAIDYFKIPYKQAFYVSHQLLMRQNSLFLIFIMISLAFKTISK